MSTEERRVQLVAEVDTTRTRSGFNEIGQQAGQMAQQVTQAGERAERAVTGVGAGAAPAARNVDGAARSIVASIQRTTAAMEAGGRQTAQYYEVMARQRGIDPNTLRPYLDQLRAVEQAQARMAASGVSSAGQIANATRMLPAQINDVIVSLQGGQRPLTVLMQQGSQISDMYGGAGTAIRSVGTYLLGLINPLSVSAVVLGSVAFAYKSGADEAAQFERSIILSGNAAGATSSKLADMSRNVAAIAGSRGAADAVAALVETAQVPADSLQKFAVVAIGAQQVLGRSVQDTVGEFEKLGKAPLQALTAIDEKYHFISASTLEQVKALQDVGKMTDAANVAQQAYAAGVQDQKDKVLATLNSWEKAWLGLKMYASDAANAVVDFAGGRDTSNFEKINKLLDERTGIQENLERAQKRNLAADVATYQAELDANKRAIDALRDKTAAQNADAKAAADAQKIDDAQKQWAKDSEKYLTRQAQLTRDLTAARNEGEAAWANLKPEDREKKITERLAGIRRQYSDIFNAGVESNIAALERRDAIEDLLAQRSLARIQTQRALGAISEQESINAQANVDLEAIDRRIENKQKELTQLDGKIYASAEQRRKDREAKEGEVDKLRTERVNREEKRDNDLLLSKQKLAQASTDLYTKGLVAATAERDGLVGQLEAQFQLNQELGLSATQVAELRAARLNSAAALKEETAASLDAVEPGSKLAQTYREQAQAMRDLGEAQVRGAYKDQMITQWRQAVDQYGQVFQQGFADMLNNGQAGWRSFTKSLVTTFKTSVADQIYRMFARPIIVQLVGSYLGVSQTAIAGEIASQQNAYGITNNSVGGAGSAIGAAQTASTLYNAISNGFSSLTTGVADAVQAGLYSTGLSSNIASNGSVATGAGWAAGTVGGYMIGSSLNSAISGKYETSSGFMTAEKIGTAVASAIFGPVGGAVAGAVSGLINRAFGMGSKEVTGQGISGTLSASSLTGQNYTTWHQDGGWFRSDKNGTDTKALTDAMVKQFTQGLSAIEFASSNFASSLGVQADWIKDYSKVFDLKLTGDATKDQQAITEFFSGIGDEIAKKLVPNLDDLSKSGETASAALERLANDFKGTDQIAQLLGFSANSLFGSAGIESAKAREQLIDLAGGLQVLSGYASTFNKEFLTDAERIAPVAAALDKALGSLGLSTIPTTRDEFKALVNSLITTGAAATESGARQLDSLLALAEAFAQVHPAADAAAEAVDKAAEALKAVKDQAAAMLAGVNDAYSVLQKVVSREKSAIQSSVDTHTAAFNKLQSLSQALHSTLDSLKSPDQKAFERAAAQAQIRAALAIAKAGGPLPDSDTLKNALSAVTQDASSQFSSYADYMRDLLQTQSDVAALAGLTDDSLSVEQKSLDALKDQLARLDDIVANGQAQLDALNGQSVATLSLAQAMAAFKSSITAAQANPVVSGTSVIAGYYQDLLGRAPDQEGLKYWQDVLASGASLENIRNVFMGSDEYKKLHPFAVGTNFVPETMPALVHEGERIIPAADNRVLMSVLARAGSGDSDALVAEIRALRTEIAELKNAAGRTADATERTAGSTGQMAEQIDNVTDGGNAMRADVFGVVRTKEVA